MRILRKDFGQARAKQAFLRWRLARTGFWFVDVPRTGSTSLRAELGQHFGDLHGKSDVDDADYARNPAIAPHRSAKQMRALLGERRWNAMYTFSFVRNPWSRALSLYHFIQKRSPDADVKSWSLNDHLEQIAMVREGGRSRYSHLRYPPITMSASDFLVDDDGALLVDDVFRFEDRASGMNVIADRLGLDKVSDVHFQAATPDDRHYTNVFDDAARRLVETMFADDIERFGYRFGDP